MTIAQIQAPTKLNRADAAEYIGIAKGTLNQWAHIGRGPKFYKAGSRVWYLVTELDAYVASRSTNCSSALPSDGNS